MKALRRDLLLDGGARARKPGWVERGGNVAVVVAVVAGLVVVEVVAVVVAGMLVGSESVMGDTSGRRRVHVDVSSEVGGGLFQDSRTRADQSVRKSVAGVLS